MEKNGGSDAVWFCPDCIDHTLSPRFCSAFYFELTCELTCAHQRAPKGVCTDPRAFVFFSHVQRNLRGHETLVRLFIEQVEGDAVMGADSFGCRFDEDSRFSFLLGPLIFSEGVLRSKGDHL